MKWNYIQDSSHIECCGFTDHNTRHCSRNWTLNPIFDNTIYTTPWSIFKIGFIFNKPIICLEVQVHMIIFPLWCIRLINSTTSCTLLQYYPIISLIFHRFIKNLRKNWNLMVDITTGPIFTKISLVQVE